MANTAIKEMTASELNELLSHKGVVLADFSATGCGPCHARTTALACSGVNVGATSWKAAMSSRAARKIVSGGTGAAGASLRGTAENRRSLP